MNIMNRITLKMLRQNKRRTIVTIIGIILSAAMITAVSTFSASFSDLFYRQEMTDCGDWHVSLRNVSNELIQKAQSDFPIDRAGRSKEEFTTLKDYSKTDAPFSLIFCEENVLSLNAIKTSEGRLPNVPGEIVLPDKYRGTDDRLIKIGDSVTLPIGSMKNDPNDSDRFIVSPSRSETFTVVGFLKNSQTAFSIKEFSYFDTLPTKNFTFHMDPLPSSLYQTLSSYPKDVGVQKHTILLCYSGVYGDRDILEALLIPVIVVGIIIFTASIILIYNAFSISVSERSRQFGMLASIGATRKQKRNAVFFEGLVLGAIAIPIGIICGIIGIGITFWAVSPWMMEAFEMTVPLRVKVVPSAIAGAALFSVITIFVSAWIPAKRASRTTPINAIRQTNEIKLRSKKVKTPKFVEKLFGFEGALALKNLKRYASRYRTTIFSLSVSIILFLTTASFTSYMAQSFSMVQSSIKSDVMYHRYQNNENPNAPLSFFSQDVLNELRSLDNVTRMQAGRQITLSIADQEKAFSDEMISYRKDNGITGSSEIRILALEPQSLKEYCKEANLSVDLFSKPNAAVAVNPVQLSSQEKNHIRINFFSEQAGQLLPVAWETLISQDDEDDSEINGDFSRLSGGTLTLSAFTDVFPLHVESTAYMPTLIVSTETLDTIIKNIDANIKLAAPEHTDNELRLFHQNIYEEISFQTNDSEALVTALGDYQDNYGGHISDIAARMRTSRRLLDLINVFFYGFITLITLVAVANVFNTISTSITLRTREFAMLRSVGMTKKGFNRMIRLESIFYGLKSLLYGLPVSILLCVLMYLGLNEEFEFSFFLPVAPIIIAVCAIFLIVGITMLYSSSKIKKMNIVSALTSEIL